MALAGRERGDGGRRGLFGLAVAGVVALALLPVGAGGAVSAAGSGLAVGPLLAQVLVAAEALVTGAAAHGLAFAVLAGLAFWGFPGAPAGVVCGALVVLGGLIEAAQFGVVGRDASVLDWLVDVLAIVAVWAAVWLGGLCRPAGPGDGRA